MKLGVFSKVFPAPSVEENFRAAAAHGFEAVQFNLSCAGLPSLPDAIDAALPRRIAEAARAHGVEIAALSGTFNMAHPDARVRRQGLARLRILASAANSIGTPLITLCTGTRDEGDMWKAHPENQGRQAWSDLLATLGAALEIAAGYGVVLAVEPEPTNVVSDADRCRRLLESLPSRHLGVVLDPANLIRGRDPGEDEALLSRAFDQLGERIVLAHAKDRDTEGNPVPAGTGQVNFPWFLRRLEAAGFSGALVLQARTQSEVAGAAAFLRRALAP